MNSFVPEIETIVKILGHSWDTENDMLKFDFKELVNYARSLPKTKRSFVRFSARIFDPLGILSCFTITLKIMFQILCCEKLIWDQELSDDLKQKWEVLIKEICYLENIHLPRCSN